MSVYIKAYVSPESIPTYKKVHCEAGCQAVLTFPGSQLHREATTGDLTTETCVYRSVVSEQ